MNHCTSSNCQSYKSDRLHDLGPDGLCSDCVTTQVLATLEERSPEDDNDPLAVLLHALIGRDERNYRKSRAFVAAAIEALWAEKPVLKAPARVTVEIIDLGGLKVAS